MMAGAFARIVQYFNTTAVVYNHQPGARAVEEVPRRHSIAICAVWCLCGVLLAQPPS